MIIKGEDNLTNKEYNKLIIRKIIEWFIYIGCILSFYVYIVSYSLIYGDQFTFFLMPIFFITFCSIFWMPVVIAIFDRKYYNKLYLFGKTFIYLFGWCTVYPFIGFIYDVFFNVTFKIDAFYAMYSILLLIPILEIIYLFARKLLKKM